MRFAAVLLFVPLILAACDSPKPPPPAPGGPGVVRIGRIRSPGWDAERADDFLTGRPLLALDASGAAVPAAARSWNHDPARARWSFETPDAVAWAAAWPAPARARAENGALVVDLPLDDPELPARLAAFAPLPNGDYAPPRRAGGSLSYAPKSGGPVLLIADLPDVRSAVLEFERGLLDRLDGLPPGHRQGEGYRVSDLAETFVLVIDLPEEEVREAVAALVDATAACVRAFGDFERAATRLAPAPLRPADLPGVPPPRRGRAVQDLVIGDDGHPESVLLASAVRALLRRAGTNASSPAPGDTAPVRVARFAAPTPAPSDFLGAFRPLAARHERLEPLFQALDSATDPAAREEWTRAVEAALLESRLLVPLARGQLRSLVRSGCRIDVDAYGRYRLRSADDSRW